MNVIITISIVVSLVPYLLAEEICDLNSNVCQTTVNINDDSLPFSITNSTIKWKQQSEVYKRWSSLCLTPSSANYYFESVCINKDCDLTGLCIVKSNDFQITFSDSNKQLTQGPRFTNELINIHVDTDETDLFNEILILEHTEQVDPFRSKPLRQLNKFEIKNIVNDSFYQNDVKNLYKNYCNLDEYSGRVEPELRYDLNNEKLFFKFSKIDTRFQTCFLFGLSVTRNDMDSSRAILVININDHRFERPTFDYPVYNFTITENLPLESLIGQVHASIYINDKPSDKDIKYKIVPLDGFDRDDQLNKIPVSINPSNGVLIGNLLIDREKYLNDEVLRIAGIGLIRLNVEASLDLAVGYCKVNIFIQDINDNAPTARIKPSGDFGKVSQDSSISNLYVNENTAPSKVLAYVSVSDPDSGENGTIKSVDFMLVNSKKPSQSTLNQRSFKLDQLKDYKNRLHSNMSMINDLIEQAQNSLISQTQQAQVPFKLSKIANSDNVYTLQLVNKLNFKQFESYSVEMKIQDNGTRPQLESKTRINLNVIDNNNYNPIFINLVNEIQISEDQYDRDALIGRNDFEWPCIFRFNAVDLDDDLNGKLVYKIVNNPFSHEQDKEEAQVLLHSTFELNKDTGELKLLRALNRDTNRFDGDHLDLIIMAQDQSKIPQKRRSANFTFRIKILDVNNNPPVFESQEFRFALTGLNQSRFIRVSSPIKISDLDQFSTNSAVNRSINNNSKFIYVNKNCFKTVGFELSDTLSSNHTQPFLFIINSDAQNQCSMTVWFDSNKLNTTISEYRFKVTVNDFGEKHLSSSALFSVKLGNYLTNKRSFKINTNNLPKILFKFDKNNFVELKSVIKLNNQLNGENSLDLFKVNQTSIEIVDNSKVLPGVYLIDIYNSSNSFNYIYTVELIIYQSGSDLDASEKLLEDYYKKINYLLENSESSIYNLNDDEKNGFLSIINFVPALTQFQSFLLGGTPVETTDNSVFSIVFGSHSSLFQFVLVLVIIGVFILALFIFCFVIFIKRTCFKKDKIKKEFKGKKNLNVVDDVDLSGKPKNCLKLDEEEDVNETGGFRRKESLKSNEKVHFEDLVNRYLDGLEPMINAPSMSSSSSTSETNKDSTITTTVTTSSGNVIDSKNNLIIPVDYYNKNVKTNPNEPMCTLSTTSSCMSDEGCYGSSDFSSEFTRDLTSCSKNKNRSIPIKQQKQNYCINNLSRFEKIYNNKLVNSGYSESNPIDIQIGCPSMPSTLSSISSSSSTQQIKQSTVNSGLVSKIQPNIISPYLVSSTPAELTASPSLSNQARTISNSGSNHNLNKIQIISSISGSYV